MGHIIINCPNKKDKYTKNDDKKKKRKKFFKKKKNGQAYYVEWDSDASSDSDDDDEDNKPSKGVAGIAIKKAPSLFSSPFCLMAKGEAKVSYDDDDDDLLDDDELDDIPSYDDLVRMLNKSNDYMCNEKKKLMDLERKYSSLQSSYEELKTTHENLKETHEKLKEAHNISLAQEVKSHVSIGVGCDIVNDRSCAPSSSNPSCSSSNTSFMNDGFTCDASLMLENKLLKEEVDKLTKKFTKWFESHSDFTKCVETQKVPINKNGIDYSPKKGKKAFIPNNSTFGKAHVRYEEEDSFKFCQTCKTRVEPSHKCKGKKDVSFDASYVLKKNVKGKVFAKFVGDPKNNTRKIAIWVPKVLVTNMQGPKQVWVPKN